jgi:hypothetical protein
MKNSVLFTVLLISVMCFSQSKTNFDYEKFSDPNPKNDLSNYFKTEIPKKFLRKATFQPKKNNIVLSFSINKENKPYRITVVTFGSTELQKLIKEAFEKYPLEKLNIASLDKKK